MADSSYAPIAVSIAMHSAARPEGKSPSFFNSFALFPLKFSDFLSEKIKNTCNFAKILSLYMVRDRSIFSQYKFKEP